jgi:ribosome-associated protein
MIEIEVGPEGIRLGQLLKYAGAVETGGEAKAVLEAGDVEVNGEVETRRGRQLGPGDEVSVADRTWRLV